MIGATYLRHTPRWPYTGVGRFITPRAALVRRGRGAHASKMFYYDARHATLYFFGAPYRQRTAGLVLPSRSAFIYLLNEHAYWYRNRPTTTRFIAVPSLGCVCCRAPLRLGWLAGRTWTRHERIITAARDLRRPATACTRARHLGDNQERHRTPVPTY
jgi:hypothetical protein